MEKLIKFNGIPLSPKTGIRNIIFDTSRYSAGMEAIRGFGTVMSESNLANIETVNLHFVLRTEELANLAYIYSLFRTLGVLVVENDYLLDKLGSSLANSLAEDRMVLHDKVVDKINGTNTSSEERFSKIHKSFKSLCMVLDNLSIKSKVNTADGYDVNMNLSLYKNSFTEEEQAKYMKVFKLWLEKTGFDKIKDEIAEQTNKLGNTSIGIDLKYYNVEALNTIYKNNLITSEFKSFRLQQDADLKEKVRTDESADNIKKRTTENKIGLEDEDFNNEDFLSRKLESVTTTIKIPNNCVMEIELITNNNIANIPIKGNSLMEKSIIGLGKTNFSCKLLFKEEEELSLVQQLKTISDKNIIGHKLQIEHPLIQLFDFYSGDILNMSFNSLENQHGIVVTMVFNINGYRYEHESLINNSDSIGDMVFKKKSKNDKLFGSWLEIFNNYLNITKTEANLTPFKKPIFEIMNSYYNSYSWKRFLDKKEVVNLKLYDFLTSYSTQFTNIANTIPFLNNDVLSVKKGDNINERMLRFMLSAQKASNDSTNMEPVKATVQNILFNVLNDDKIIKQLTLTDMNSMYNLMNYFDGAFSLYKNLKSSKYISYNILELSNSEEIDLNFLRKIVRPITTEMFNDKINLQAEDNKIYRKIFEEFFLRMLNLINFLKIDENMELVSQKGTFKYFHLFNFIKKCAGEIIQVFLNVLDDGKFIKRITEEIYHDVQNINQAQREYVRLKIKQIRNEYQYYYKNNKENIEFTIYNIFLLRLTCFNLIENKLESLDKLTKNEKINDLVKSTVLCVPMLLKTDNRTDTFGLCVETCFSFLGQMISSYNFELESEKMFWFSELKQQYGNNIDIYNSDCVYVMRTKYEDLGEQKGQIIGDLAKKDIDYLYGEKIPRLSLFSLIGKVFYNSEIDQDEYEVKNFINNQRYSFLAGVKYSSISLEDSNKDAQEFFVENSAIGNIHLPSDNKEKFTTRISVGDERIDEENENKVRLNVLMKSRMIANNDPFFNVLQINKTVCDNIDTLFPDYVIVVNVKETVEDEINEYYVQLKNITNISISKNPKTKIKTASFTITMPSKGFYNFNMNDGAFSIKTMRDGKIRGFIIKPGCEVRIMLGYNFNNSYSIFNGVVAGSQEVGNSLMITCADFASSLYNFIPNDLEVTNKNSLNYNKANLANVDNVNEANDEFREMKQPDIVKNVENEFIDALRNKRGGLVNPNMYLFESYGDNFADTYAQQGSASYSMITQLMLIRMDYKYRPYFENVFKEESLNRDLNYLATNFQNKIDLTQAFGSGTQNSLEVIGNSLTNIYDVDLDYEAYGYVKVNPKDNKIIPGYEEGKSPYVPSNYSNTISTGNVPPGMEKEYMMEPCHPCVVSDDRWIKNQGAWFGTDRYDRNGNFSHYHKGVDFKYSAAEPSKNVYAVADGIVTFVHPVDGKDGGGNYVCITHGDGITETRYLHLEKYNVIQGQRVKKGDVIGKIGRSGKTQNAWKGAHLHFEVRLKKNSDTMKLYEELKKMNGKEYVATLLHGVYVYVNPILYLKGSYSVLKYKSSNSSSSSSSSKTKGQNQFTIDYDKAKKDPVNYFKEKIKGLEGFSETFYTDSTKKVKGSSIGYGFHTGGFVATEEIFSKADYKKYVIDEKPMEPKDADRILDLGYEYIESRFKKGFNSSNKGKYDQLPGNQKVALMDLAWKYSVFDVDIVRKVYYKLIQGDTEGAALIVETKYGITDKDGNISEGLKLRRDYVINLIKGE